MEPGKFSNVVAKASSFFPPFLKLYPQMVKDEERPLLKNNGLGSGLGFPLGRGRGLVPLFSGTGGAVVASFVSEHQS